MHDVTTQKAPILIDTVVTIWLRHNCGYNFVDAGSRAVSDRLTHYWRNRGFESLWLLGCCTFYVLHVVQDAVSATSWSLVQGSLTGCVWVCVCVCVM